MPAKQAFPFYSIGDFINQPSNPTEMEVLRFEAMAEPEVEDLHKHSFYEIIWVEDGISKQVIDYNEYIIEPNTLFFISPGQLHYFEEWQPLRGGSIMFTEAFFLSNYANKDKLFELAFLDNVYANPNIRFGTEDFLEIRRTIEWLVQEQQAVSRNLSITQSLLHILLSQVQRSLHSDRPSVSRRNMIVYKRFKEVLDRHFAENQSPSFYADALHITQHHLNLVVKSVTGHTTGEAIRARSVLEAKRMLTFSDDTVGNISAALGYYDSSYFAKLFRAETGCSPLQFKAAMSDKYRRM